MTRILSFEGDGGEGFSARIPTFVTRMELMMEVGRDLESDLILSDSGRRSLESIVAKTDGLRRSGFSFDTMTKVFILLPKAMTEQAKESARASPEKIWDVIILGSKNYGDPLFHLKDSLLSGKKSEGNRIQHKKNTINGFIITINGI